MKKLKDLLKESHVWERKFGEPLPTLADVQRKKLAEGKWTMKGKYLAKDGGTTSIPGPYDNDALKVTVGRESFNIYKGRRGIIAIGDKYSKEFRNARDLIKWLNKNRAKYVGIDNR